MEALEFADTIVVIADNACNALKLFNRSTAIGTDQLHLRRMAKLPDSALHRLDCSSKQSIATLKVQIQELLNLLGLLVNKLGAIT